MSAPVILCPACRSAFLAEHPFARVRRECPWCGSFFFPFSKDWEPGTEGAA